MDNEKPLRLTRQEIERAFADPVMAGKFPPLMSVDQAAELLQVPKATIYSWRSRRLLSSCSRSVGKRVLFVRDRLIQQVFNEGLNP